METNLPKRRGLFVILIIVAIMIFGFSKSSNNKLPKEYEWISGIWTCQTMFGPVTYRMGPDMSFSDNEGHSGTYRIEDGAIYTQVDGTLGFRIEVDGLNKRIGPGGECWMIRISK
jgi:hypothetical protein